MYRRSSTDISGWTTYTMSDILGYEEPEHVKIEDGQIGFQDIGYWIDLTRIPNHEAMIEWIHHLMGKNWVTKDMLEQFIEKVCKYHNWPIYHGY